MSESVSEDKYLCVFRYTAQEAFSIIEEKIDNGDDGDDEIILIPPIENCDAETDKDSDLSDDECQQDINRLPRRVLNAEAEIWHKNKKDNDDDDEKTIRDHDSSTQNKPKKRKCMAKKQQQENGDWIMEGPDINETLEKDTQPRMLFHGVRSNISSPIDCFKYFCDEDFVEMIKLQTNKYLFQRGREPDIAADEVYSFLGILLLSGYNQLPYRRMYWSMDGDLTNEMVSNSMRRDRFDYIMSNIHFADNTAIDINDRYYKVRPLFEQFNTKSEVYPKDDSCCVDESMIRYYGHHSSKQFVKNKPIKYGFKTWCLNSSRGYLYMVEPYCGKDTNIQCSSNGSGYDVVMHLVESSGLPRGTHLYFDNYFTSIPLLEHLYGRGIGATGTIRANRLKDCPIRDISSKGMARGETAYASNGDKNVNVILWNDNRKVLLATSCYNVQPFSRASRWSSKDSKRIKVKMPQPLEKYNNCMGGTDLFNQALNQYRIRIRSKKWYWSLFSWLMNAMVVNSWLFYRDTNDPQMSLLNFLRQVTSELLRQYGRQRIHAGE